MNYSQLFQDSYGNVIPVVRALAQGMDESEEKLEHIRVSLGLGDDWSPVQERRLAANPHDSVKWTDKTASLNGMGDFRTLVGEMCAGLEKIEARLDEAVQKLVAGPVKPYVDLSGDGERLIVPAAHSKHICPKCGEHFQRLDLHVRACKAGQPSA